MVGWALGMEPPIWLVVCETCDARPWVTMGSQANDCPICGGPALAGHRVSGEHIAALWGRSGVADVLAEREAQDAKWGKQSHPYLDHWGWRGRGAQIERQARRSLADGEVTWPAILAEEVGEALCAGTPADVRAELVQVAAVALAWIEDIDNGGA